MKNQKKALFVQSYFNITRPFSRFLCMKKSPCGTIVPHGDAKFSECFSFLPLVFLFQRFGSGRLAEEIV